MADAPANLGGICAKGATLGQVIQTPDRLMMPQLRTDREKERRPVGWAEALMGVRPVPRDHRKTRPGRGRVLRQRTARHRGGLPRGKLFKGSIGTNNTDSNSRLCMAAAVAGYRTSLGTDGPPTCYDDIDLTDCMVIWGSNMAEALPVTFDRIRARLKANPEVDLIVVDPRRTTTAEAANLHVPVAPGGDIALMNALGRLLLDRDAVDRRFVAEHTEGFEDYRDFLLQADWRELVEASGVSEALVRTLAARIAGARRCLSFYCMGLNQSTVGMWKNNSLINLHLLTGQIGKPGAGPFSLTGQPNAMGGREAGLLSHSLPGYRSPRTPATGPRWRSTGAGPGDDLARPGLTAVEMFRALESGQLKAIWIAGTNPAVSLPDLHQVRRALAKAELVVVQDAYHPTETSRLADVLLPAAQWGEKEWTSTNSERIVRTANRLSTRPARPCPTGRSSPGSPRRWASPGSTSRIRPGLGRVHRADGGPALRHGGHDHRAAAGQPTLAMALPDADHPGTERLYLDRKFPTPTAGPVPPETAPAAARATDHEFPLVLTTGRLYAHWHTLTRTGKSPKLVQREPSAFVEIHPDDAAQSASSRVNWPS